MRKLRQAIVLAIGTVMLAQPAWAAAKDNAELAKEWPVITQRKEPPADADAWKDIVEKLPLLER